MSLEECEEFFETYWHLFSKVRLFAVKCSKYVRKQGYIVNPFGFRVTPKPNNAFNALIQSTVNGVIQHSLKILQEEAPYYEFISPYHDELIGQIPEDMLEHFKQAHKNSQIRLNEMLEWTVPIRLGLATGKNMYEAK